MSTYDPTSVLRLTHADIPPAYHHHAATQPARSPLMTLAVGFTIVTGWWAIAIATCMYILRWWHTLPGGPA